MRNERIFKHNTTTITKTKQDEQHLQHYRGHLPRTRS